MAVNVETIEEVSAVVTVVVADLVKVRVAASEEVLGSAAETAMAADLAVAVTVSVTEVAAVEVEVLVVEVAIDLGMIEATTVSAAVEAEVLAGVAELLDGVWATAFRTWATTRLTSTGLLETEKGTAFETRFATRVS